MKTTKINITISEPFDLEKAITGHGWAVLLPNRYDRETGAFTRVDRLSSGRVIRVRIALLDETPENCFRLEVQSKGNLAKEEKKEIVGNIRHMLRLDEDFSPFYEKCARSGDPWDDLCDGGGRLMRSPSLFEDFVKVILTTNIHWDGTRRMVAEIVAAYGEAHTSSRELKTFPLPEVIVADSLNAFKKKVSLGYRAEYIHGLAAGFAGGEIAESAFVDVSKSTRDVRKNLLAIKGIGSYAAATMLMLLGRYDDIPVDTIFREFMAEKYFKDGKFDRQAALAVYESWGEWKYLAYWFDNR